MSAKARPLPVTILTWRFVSQLITWPARWAARAHCSETWRHRAVRTPTEQYLEGRGQTEPASRLVVEWMRQAWTTSRRPTHRHQQSQPRRLRQPPTYPSEKVTSVTVNLKHILPLSSYKFDIHQNRFRSFLAGVLLTKSEKVKKNRNQCFCTIWSNSKPGNRVLT